ncbi:MAG TPA: hypothetical protein VMH77_08485 [Steroidobacteraceae bacterium]|nr:hypothetical protein [Steroidobacteraceae bacterium]
MNRMIGFSYMSVVSAAVLAVPGTIDAAQPAAIPAYITAAVADASRPDSDRQRDVNRKPAEVLAFAGVQPGDQVGELMAGGGYFTRLFCKIVGNTGHVYTMNITATKQMDRPPPDAPRPGPAPAPAAAPSGEACTNVTADAKPAAQFALPAGLDLVWTSENYHDLHNDMFGKPDMLVFDKAVFAALKPGGVFMVEDHAAAAGTGASVTETLHRIDVEQVKKEVTAAGFVFEAASTVLANPEDPHTEGPFKLNGRSDKFLLRFRKPAK